MGKMLVTREVIEERLKEAEEKGDKKTADKLRKILDTGKFSKSGHLLHSKPRKDRFV